MGSLFLQYSTQLFRKTTWNYRGICGQWSTRDNLWSIDPAWLRRVYRSLFLQSMLHPYCTHFFGKTTWNSCGTQLYRENHLELVWGQLFCSTLQRRRTDCTLVFFCKNNAVLVWCPTISGKPLGVSVGSVFWHRYVAPPFFGEVAWIQCRILFAVWEKGVKIVAPVIFWLSNESTGDRQRLVFFSSSLFFHLRFFPTLNVK